MAPEVDHAGAEMEASTRPPQKGLGSGLLYFFKKVNIEKGS